MSEIGQIRSLAKYNQSWGKQSIRDEIITLCDKALQERDELQRKLDMAMEAMKRIPHNANHTKHFACHGCEMDEAIAAIEKEGKDE